MNKAFKYYEIEIDGVDRTGKDTLTTYLALLSNHKFSINTRGIITQIAYSKKFNRGYEYDLSNLSKNKLIVLLRAYSEDLEIRCKMTNEKDFSIKDDLKLFNDVATDLLNKGYDVRFYNTSYYTPYMIAKDIIEYLENKEQDNN